MAAGVQFKCGEQFPSLGAFKDKLWRYEESNYVSFYIRDVKTLQSAIKCGYRVHAYDSSLVYYYVKYCCVHGGKMRKSSTSNRISKRGCPAFIYLKATNDGKCLEIRKLDTSHNHEVSEELFKRLPQQQQQHRKNPVSDGAKTKCLIPGNLKTESSETKITTTSSPSPPLPVIKICVSSAVAAKLQDEHKATIRISTDDEGNLQSLFIQDELMRRDFDLYPDLMYADVSHTLLDVNASVYVLMTENAAGEYAVAALGLLVAYDVVKTSNMKTLDWFLNTFKESNESWNRIRVIMTDRDPKNRSAFKRHFPRASYLTCVVHSLRAFKREVMSAKSSLDIFHRMAVARDLEEFEEHRDTFRYLESGSVLRCFDEQWDGCREEWAMGLNFGSVRSLQETSTNSQIELFVQKLKAFAPTLAPSLESVVGKLFRLLILVRLDRCEQSSSLMSNSTLDCLGTAELQYRSLLTNYSFELVQKEMQATVQATEMQQRSATDFQLTTSDGSRQVTSTRCDCPFNVLLKLPCRHVFEIRKILGLNPYDADLCAERWLQALYKIHCDFLVHEFRTSSLPRRPLQTTTTDLKRKWEDNGVPEMSTEEKYRKALRVATEIAEYVSQLEDDEFEEKIRFLQDLYQTFKAESEEETANVSQNGDL